MTATKSKIEPWTEEELRTKVGQLFIVGFHGYVPSEDIKILITTHKVGAVILFLRNVASAAQLLDLTKTLQETARKSGHEQDLFIAIDQENGLVTRIKSPIATQLPGAMALRATGDALNTYNVALATAETLKSFGINFNYAPVADINSNPRSPVIGVRSPSDDPETVGRFVSAQVKGFKAGRIVSCVKHFPGHGETAVDSHHGLPVISKSKAMLDTCELVPFRRVVVEGVDAVMTAHIAMPGIGDSKVQDDHTSKKLPASLSQDAIKILREEMKYDGLIISDCLEMDGVRATYGTKMSAVMALKAGTDCVMICHTMAAQVEAIELVIEAVKSGKLSQEAVQASVQRVRYLKTKYLSRATPPAPTDLQAMFAKQTTLASKIYAKSTTVVRSDPNSFPISSKPSNIVFINPDKVPTGGGAVESGEDLEEKTREPNTIPTYVDLLRVHNRDIVDIKFIDGAPLSPKFEKAIKGAARVILATRNASLSPYQKELGLSLGKKLGNKLIVIATCDPYDYLEDDGAIKNYITIYEPTIPAFKSAVDVIFGLTKSSGTLPIGRLAIQHEIQVISSSDEECKKMWDLWQEIFPNWPIGLERLQKILRHPAGKHYLHEKGLCISFFLEGGHGKISALGVQPDFRGKGLGTALLTRAKEGLMARKETLVSLGIGSDFPRFWPGVPIDFLQTDKDFFVHRGFRKFTAPTARDLYRNITENVAPIAVLERVSKLPLKYAPWSPELYKECMAKQRANFKNLGWINAYERQAAANQHHEVMVAFDGESGAQVGWTLMSSQSSVVCDDFAFLPLAPSKDKTGLIACVGVDEHARGKGVGLALLVKAMENMRERGIEGVIIDWVVIRGFYENLGYNVCWEYEGYDL